MYFHAEQEPKPPVLLDGFGDARIKVYDQYVTRNGKPWIPVMGEIHYSRVPVCRWRETLEKMKAGGIDIAASYVIWIHHEEERGTFDFTGNRDLRRFILLCHEVGLEFCLRIGPWAHGECRGGGFPDWLVSECGSTLRTEEEPYAGYARRFLSAVADQIRGLPLIGIQIENEMTYRPAYMESLCQYVKSVGLTAPLFTATGWGNAKLPKSLLPMFGGYPEAPWEGHVQVLSPNPNYFFSYQREDGNIGRDLLGETDGTADPAQNWSPFMTCELGGGNQVTYHRRPLFSCRDITALAITKLGNGANLLGYYMYAGGCNPVGKTTTQESRATGYPNDCPVISYDFQAPIGDMGQLRESYFALLRLHTFLHSFGETLAKMPMVLPDRMPKSLADEETLRCALRTNGHGGFLFVNNHVRLKHLPPHKNTAFTFVFADKTVTLQLDIPADAAFFMPVGMTLCGISTAYVTAQPVEQDPKTRTVVLERIPGIVPRLAKDGEEDAPVLLETGVNRIGDTEVILLDPPAYHPSKRTPLSVEPLQETCCPADILMGHLSVHSFADANKQDEALPDLTREYRVRWNADTRYLVIRAKGNLAGFYVEDHSGEMHLVSDQYLYGGDWVIDVRFLDVTEGILKVQPFRAEDRGTVYLETEMEIGDFTPEVFQVNEDPMRL